MRMRSAVLLSGMLSCLTLCASAQFDNYQLYHILLTPECPAKHLAWLSPANLNDIIIIDFKEALTAPQKQS